LICNNGMNFFVFLLVSRKFKSLQGSSCVFACAWERERQIEREKKLWNLICFRIPQSPIWLFFPTPMFPTLLVGKGVTSTTATATTATTTITLVWGEVNWWQIFWCWELDQFECTDSWGIRDCKGDEIWLLRKFAATDLYSAVQILFLQSVSQSFCLESPTAADCCNPRFAIAINIRFLAWVLSLRVLRYQPEITILRGSPVATLKWLVLNFGWGECHSGGKVGLSLSSCTW
jgi:hypothetical protein